MLQRRDKLFAQLKELPVHLQKSDSINIIEEILLKQIKAQRDVDSILDRRQKFMPKPTKPLKAKKEQEEEQEVPE